MIEFYEACRISYKALRKNGYSGIGLIKQSDEFWTFSGKGKDPGYCCEDIIIFKDDSKRPPQILQWSVYDELMDEIDSAEILEIPEEFR